MAPDRIFTEDQTERGFCLTVSAFSCAFSLHHSLSTDAKGFSRYRQVPLEADDDGTETTDIEQAYPGSEEPGRLVQFAPGWTPVALCNFHAFGPVVVDRRLSGRVGIP